MRGKLYALRTAWVQGVSAVYGLEDEAPLNQSLGSVVTQQARCIAFPNVLQHRVGQFELQDPTAPGHRKICALFLVDPNKRIRSTATVPPQQHEWFCQELLLLRRFKEMPPSVRDHVFSYSDWPMDRAAACAHRERLMHERSVLVGQHNDEAFERSFSLCEH